jgi:serine/threonine protein kinase/tetratricopeptide (TPR) repeat protein
MNPERWQRLQDVFNDALAVPVAERERWLASACGGDANLLKDVQALLAADDEGAHAPLADPVRDALVSLTADHPPLRIGPYQLLEQIGRGGMGAVYKAQRVDREYHSIVAIKLVRAELGGAVIVERFRQERQILARLTHPSIARLLDGGTSDDGSPYIVMEYIDGVGIAEYCESKRLDLRARLELFLPVCSAVDYAHHNFIVHRDIKPNNILVDRAGTPKLLDFGISKLLHADGREAEPALTQCMAAILTPHYASPEQVLGAPVTTRSDVYSLGTVLYELLTGARAHHLDKLTPRAIEDAICRTDVPVPSTVATDARLARRLAGDLDNIVMRAMQKDPERRYESAAALADDMRRYLDDLPVHARPDTTVYRARKFVRRHRALVASTAAVIVALIAGVGVAVQQARVAEARERQVRSLAKVFLFDVHDSIKDAPGTTKARQTIVETAVRYLDALAGSSPTEPELLRELAAGYMRVGDIQGGERSSNLGDAESAQVNYRKSIGLLDALIGQDPSDRQALLDHVRVQHRITDIEARTVGATKALGSLALAVDAARRLSKQYPTDVEVVAIAGDLLMTAGRRRREVGDLDLSLQMTNEALTMLEPLSRQSPDDVPLLRSVAAAESAVGMAQEQLGNLAEALQHYERAVTRNEKVNELEPENVAGRRNLMISYSHVGDVLGYPNLPNLEDREGAERTYRKMTALARRLYEADADDLRAVGDYGIASMRLGVVIPMSRASEKREALERALGLMRTVLDKSPGNLNMRVNACFAELQVGDFFRDLGRAGDAVAYYRRAVDLSQGLLDMGNVSPAGTFIDASGELAKIEADLGRRDAAMTLLNRALAFAEKTQAGRSASENLGSGRSLLPRVHGAIAAVHARLGDDNEADEWRAKALAEWKELSTKRGFTNLMRAQMEAIENEAATRSKGIRSPGSPSIPGRASQLGPVPR